ncbi:MAG: hypothetical protein JNL26_04470 [Gemmatimonadetes bacterium]|nr:hypothetical protein [Gemmatimonadota bacterium]
MAVRSSELLTTQAPSRLDAAARAWWVLRLGAALCYIGHGAFGFITKAAWLPYFAVVGIPESWAWRIMPWVGAVDVMAGMAVLFAPTRLPLLYMVGWAMWTALLRPLAGESAFEAVERAGNYGVPLALLVAAGFPRTWRQALAPLDATTPFACSPRLLAIVLRVTTSMLLLGHGALGAFVGPASLQRHTAAMGLPTDAMVWLGYVEIGLALLVALRPWIGLLLFVAVWKLATESLFYVSGSPIWEVIERAGSYAAPLALTLLLWRERQQQGSAAAPTTAR